MSVPDRDAIPDSIRDQAANWLARNQGDHPQVAEVEFRDWLSRDLRHRLAYAEADRAWRDSVFLSNTRTGRERTLLRAPFHMRRTTHLVAASLVVTLCVGLVSVHFGRDLPGFGIGTQVEARSFQTAPGQTRTWQLSDGTTLTLSGASLARSHYDAGLKRIDLVQGSARISVAGGDIRPVQVSAFELTITTHGGEFNVSSTAAANSVDVISGRVQATLHGGEIRTLSAGQSAVALPAIKSVPVAQGNHAVRPILGTAEMTIGDAAQQLNQHNLVQIHLSGGVVASKHLAGAFFIDDPDAFADAVAVLDNLKVERSPDSIILKPR